MQYTDKMQASFLRRAYAAVDGLWFMKVEELYSYEEALKLDKLVWQIMPKIETRKARELTGADGDSLSDLSTAIGLKMTAEGFDFSVPKCTDNLLIIEADFCPWMDILKKAGRDHLSVEICKSICDQELDIWATEFSSEIKASIESRISEGAEKCRLCFRK